MGFILTQNKFLHKNLIIHLYFDTFKRNKKYRCVKEIYETNIPNHRIIKRKREFSGLQKVRPPPIKESPHVRGLSNVTINSMCSR